MVTDLKLKRINELARKSKTEGLTAKESLEQKKLRNEYLQEFRAGFRKQLDSIQFVDDKDDSAPTVH